MALFSKDNQPVNRRGKSKKADLAEKLFSDELVKDSFLELHAAVKNGESWAVTLILDRVLPKLKPVTIGDSLDGQLLELKIKEIAEFEMRLAEIEKSLLNETTH